MIKLATIVGVLLFLLGMVAEGHPGLLISGTILLSSAMICVQFADHFNADPK